MVTKSTKTVSPAATRAIAPDDSSSFEEIEVVESQLEDNENSTYESDIDEGGESVKSTETLPTPGTQMMQTMRVHIFWDGILSRHPLQQDGSWGDLVLCQTDQGMYPF
jgi:hypothetical protein